MQRGKKQIMKLLDEIRREIEFDDFNLTRYQQDTAKTKICQIEEFFNELYSGK